MAHTIIHFFSLFYPPAKERLGLISVQRHIRDIFVLFSGPYVSGFLSNITGRKPCLFLGAAISLLSFLVLALAQNLAMIFTGRILIGLGTGIIFVTNLVYIGEIA